MYVRIEKAATLMGVAKSTLRRWEKKKKLKADYRTLGGHRRYNMVELLQMTKQVPENKEEEKTIRDEMT